MSKLTKRTILEHVPKLNSEIVNGLTVPYVNKGAEYIHSIFRDVNKSFPAGLEYIGYEVCTPREQFIEATRPRKNKYYFNLARSDLYLVKFLFKFNGKDLPPKYIYLPFVEDGGILHLSGGTFHISPVSTDKVISPSTTCVFIRLLRDKLNFERIYHDVVVDGKTRSRHVVWGKIHKKKKELKIPPTTKANTTVLHYLLGKIGFNATFSKYLGFIPIVGTDDITREKYPIEDYVICESTKVKPATCMDKVYTPTNIKLAIPRDKWNAGCESFVYSLYYIIDHFPNRITAKYIDNITIWKVLLGTIIWTGLYSDPKLYNDTEEHYVNINDYVDIIISEKLNELGYKVENFYDLLALIAIKFNDWIIQASENYGSLYNKSMEVLYYVFYDITSGIFKTIFKLSQLSIKRKNDENRKITEDDIKNVMKKFLTMGAMFKMIHENIAVSTVNDPGDNKLFKLTTLVIQQQTISGPQRMKKKSKSGPPISQISNIKFSSSEVGSIHYLSKKSIDPACRLNPFININLKTGNPIPDPEFDKLRHDVDRMLSHFLQIPDIDIKNDDDDELEEDIINESS